MPSASVIALKTMNRHRVGEDVVAYGGRELPSVAYINSTRRSPSLHRRPQHSVGEKTLIVATSTMTAITTTSLQTTPGARRQPVPTLETAARRNRPPHRSTDDAATTALPRPLFLPPKPYMRYQGRCRALTKTPCHGILTRVSAIHLWREELGAECHCSNIIRLSRRCGRTAADRLDDGAWIKPPSPGRRIIDDLPVQSDAALPDKPPGLARCCRAKLRLD